MNVILSINEKEQRNIKHTSIILQMHATDAPPLCKLCIYPVRPP